MERARLSKAYDELQQISDLMKYYKQENIDILTLAEIENKNPTLNALEARLSELTGK
jgi:predicted extracellular nuclease